MPITLGSATIELKLLPLFLYDSGEAQVTVRKGYTREAGGEFFVTETKVISIPKEDVNAILDTDPTPGLSRRDDLSLAVYQYLVTSGQVEAGSIS